MLKSLWMSIRGQFDKFEAWVADSWPGWKTRIVTGLGALGSFAGLVQEYITGIPLDKLVDTQTAVIFTAILFTLAYWFRRLADKT